MIGHKDNQGIGEFIIQGEAERATVIQTGEEKAQGDLINMWKYLIGRNKNDFSWCCPVKTKEHEQYIPFKHTWFLLNIIKKFFYYEGGLTLEEVSQRSCGVSILEDMQNPTVHSPEQPPFADSGLS